MNKISIFIKYVLSVIVCISMMTGCVEEYEADLSGSETRLLVVDGMILSNQPSQFHLTWSSSLNNTPNYLSDISYDYSAPIAVVGAKVVICGTDGTEYECKEVEGTGQRFKEGYYYDADLGTYVYDPEGHYEEYSYGTGYYSCELPELNPEVSYYITIKYRSDVYQSTPEKPIRTPDIESLEYFQKDSLSDVEVLLTTAAPDDPDNTSYFTWDYTETWELRPTRFTSMYFDVGDNVLDRYVNLYDNSLLYPRYGWKIADSDGILIGSTVHYAGGKFNKYQLVSIPRDDERISWNYCHDLRLRAISKGEYEYQMACRQAGWEMGGLFTPQPSAMPTNIQCLTSSNRVIGYVGCAQNVVTKRMYIDGKKISRILPEEHVRVIYAATPAEMDGMAFNMLNEGWLLTSFNKEMNHNTGQSNMETHWLPAEYLDVRKRGAGMSVFTDKPEYMPPFGEEYSFTDRGYNVYPNNNSYNQYYETYDY